MPPGGRGQAEGEAAGSRAAPPPPRRSPARSARPVTAAAAGEAGQPPRRGGTAPHRTAPPRGGTGPAETGLPPPGRGEPGADISTRAFDSLDDELLECSICHTQVLKGLARASVLHPACVGTESPCGVCHVALLE
ncbi:uncharacterized protein J5F26_017052 isoform 1-T1 [Ciconia maguari]